MSTIRASICLLGLLFVSETLSAQTSIGFRNPGNTASLKEYRLPAWSYQSFYVDGGGYYNSYTSENPNNSMVYDRYQFSSHLSATTHWYSEEDDRILSFSAYPQVSGSYESSKDTYEDGTERHRNQTGYETPISFYAGLKWYLTPNLFLDASPSMSFRRYHYINRDEPVTGADRRSTREYASFQTSQLFGVGFGRVRNVTPVIRALRFYERLAQLDPDRSESQNNIIETASVFAKHTGYVQTFDRSNNVFWTDVIESANLSAETMRPFDILYLMETNSEFLVDRFEGWDVKIGPKFYATRQLNKEKNQDYNVPDYRDFSVTYHYGAEAEFRYFMNPTLNRMFSFHVIGSMEKSNLNSFYWNDKPLYTTASAEARWMEQVADRFTVQQWVSALYRQNQFDNIDITSKALNIDYGLNFSYFIENSTSLNLTVRVRRLVDVFDAPLYSYGSDVKGQAHASIGIRHYFGRSANL